MIKNYLKTAWRTLIRDKAFAVINITGLAIGMAGALLIAIWLQNMLTMDRFHEKIDQLYVMSDRDSFGGKLQAWPYTPKILASVLKSEYPGVEGVSRYDDENDFLVKSGDKQVMGKTAFVDPDFFQMFSFPFVSGNAAATFNNVSSVIITEKFAHALFGKEDPIGKVFTLDKEFPVTVTAVLKDLPENTQMKFECLLSWDFAAKNLHYVDSNWTNNSVQTYMLLNKNADLTAFNKKVKDIIISHGNPNSRPTTEVFAHPYKNYYLYNGSKDGEYTTGRIEQVRLFTIIGIFILLIACINFMNLSTARSEKRAREIGVRKVMGASKLSLIWQFITESLIISFFAFLVAAVIVVCCLPALNNLIERNLSIRILHTNTWLFALAFVVIAGLLAGSYPAFILSSFRPVASLKGTYKINQLRIQPRSVLVILQFSFAIMLIISTIIVTRQINHTQSRERGYDQSGLAYTNIVGDLQKNYPLLRDELLRSGAVTAVSKNMSPITSRSSDGWGLSWTGSTADDNKTDFLRFSSDADFINTMKMTLTMGRDIDVYKYPTDSAAMLLTETAVKAMHLRNPLEATVHDNGQDWHVVGVIRDFIIESPFDKITPMIIQGPNSWFNTIHYRLNPAHNKATNMAAISSIFKKFNPDFPYDYQFVDDMYSMKFKDLQVLKTLSSLFAGLAIGISCIGLLGMVSYMAKARRKEIAIRKVLGATLMNLSFILSKSFLKLVTIAIAIASPIAWYYTSNWLNGYHYHIAFPWWVFGAAGAVAILITLVTISIQTISAALANPVKSLHAE
ncbi:FtsX-like permease family protein [Chitinophaga dinghuensis]|uniref:FtsX-like permease family protein n=1 Tax=Chitinophaga dinghuensis TaxID=1539050 RepID=A0A327VWH2_9BACT|nr:ABC transporter permease [Chitinophaga dinghuensis]RAJ80351.1 FtsX-like permease family protein [Chitinophaga dinghuensis]